MLQRGELGVVREVEVDEDESAVKKEDGVCCMFWINVRRLMRWADVEDCVILHAGE